MSITLKRTGDHFRWKFDSWETVLALAVEFGWDPSGTNPPRGIHKRDWDAMDYISPQRQTVTAADASNMAEALSRSLDKISNDPTKRLPKRSSKGVRAFWGWHRAGLQDFVDYCQRGSFRVTDDPFEQ